MTYNTSANTHLSSLPSFSSALLHSHHDHVLDFSGLWYEANAVLEDDDKNPELYQGMISIQQLLYPNPTLSWPEPQLSFPSNLLTYLLTYLFTLLFCFCFVVLRLHTRSLSIRHFYVLFV